MPASRLGNKVVFHTVFMWKSEVHSFAASEQMRVVRDCIRLDN